MAPRKRKSGDSEQSSTTAAATKPNMSRRVTRSSAAAASTGSSVALSVEPTKKRAKKKTSKEKEASDETLGSEIAEADVGSKTFIIEHWTQVMSAGKEVRSKQCNSFKTRAIQVKNGLEKGVPGITVLVNPEKPRRGCFEIREDGGEKFITLLDMKRPFTKMKELNMDKVISDIVMKVK